MNKEEVPKQIASQIIKSIIEAIEKQTGRRVSEENIKLTFKS